MMNGDSGSIFDSIAAVEKECDEWKLELLDCLTGVHQFSRTCYKLLILFALMVGVERERESTFQ